MGAYLTRLSANIAVDYMKGINFMPKTLLNIGVGSCPELAVWKKRLPEVALLGVDVRHRRWDAPCVVAVVSDVSKKDAEYCKNCRSIKCQDPTHSSRRGKIGEVKTIDEIVEETKVQAPFFLWMDIEGAELDALKGATKTLVNVPLINIEMREFQWTTNYCNELHDFLVSNEYSLVDISSRNTNNMPLEDKLYVHIGVK